MKRIAALTLALLLALAACPASAAQNTLLFRQDDDEFHDYIHSLCAVGDALWMVGQRAAYVYDAETGAVEAWPWPEGFGIQGVRDKDGSMLYTGVNHIFEYEGCPCVLKTTTRYSAGFADTESAVVCRLVTADGALSLEEIGSIRFQDAVLDDSFMAASACMAGDRLCVIVQNGLSQPAPALFPPDGSPMIEVDAGRCSTELPDAVFPYGDGAAVQYTVLDDDGNLCLVLLTIDPDTGRTEELARIPGQCGGLAEEPGTGRVLYVESGLLKAFDPADGSIEEILAIPVGISYGDRAACTENGLYAAASYEGVIVRDIRAVAETETLAVGTRYYSDAATQAALDFGTAHPEISVVIAEVNDTDDILNALVTRLPDTDIFEAAFRYDNGVMTAVLDRGWALELDSEALTDYVGSMYPALAERFMRNGKPVAVPLEAQAIGFGVSVGTLAQSGLTMDDIPQNWPEMIAFIAAQVENDAPYPLTDMGTEDSVRIKAGLLNRFIEDYLLELQLGTLDGFDTPEFRAVLTALDALDCDALAAHDRAFEENGYPVNPLLGTYDACSVCTNTMTEAFDWYPLRLSVGAKLPARLPLDCVAAFVNPASEHIEEATAFLEEAARHVGAASLATMIPSLNEPVRSPDYEWRIAEQDAAVAELEALLAETEEGTDEYETVSEKLDSARLSRTLTETYGWTVTPQSLDWYRAHDGQVMAREDFMGGFFNYSVAMRYAQGEWTADALIAELDRQIQMTRLENQ